MKRLLVPLLLLTLPAAAAFRMPFRGREVMVASTSEIASRVGADVMKKGGNAIDAAVATALALAVTWPGAGNIGGGGFMLIRKADGTAELIDYRGVAPGTSSRDMFLDAEGNVIKGLSTYGHKASAVPGTVAGLKLAHERHGQLEWKKLVEPARRLAGEGFVVNDFIASTLRDKDVVERISRFPESRRIFLRDGRPWQAGERITQPDLARTLARIERDPRDFYEGETADLIVKEMKRHRGLLTIEDLRSYRPIVRQPLRGSYRDVEILAPPPPSSGGTTLLEALNILEAYDLQTLGWHSAAYVHVVVEALRRAFADRAMHVGDPDFVDVPTAQLISKDYAATRRATIDRKRASRSSVIGAGAAQREPLETTHFSIVDAAGNVVSNTYTINNWYGNGVTVPGAGFLMNDDMDDFTVKPGTPNSFNLVQGEQNAIAPKKRPISSMTPVILVKDGQPWMALGSPGGPRIITVVLHVILNVVDFGMSLQDAIDAPRFHHQWQPDEIYWEPLGMNPDTRMLLENMGHVFRARGEIIGIGEGTGIMIEPGSGARLGAGDPRRQGAAAGW